MKKKLNLININNKKNLVIRLFNLIILTNLFVYIIGCSNFNDISEKSYTNNIFICEEYINRIGKLLLIVDNKKYYNEINFLIKNQNLPSLEIFYHNTHLTSIPQVIISKGTLHYLQDEAELTTILAIALEKINYPFDFESPNINIAHKADARIIQHLYKAGYDPKAYIELQTEYLKNKNFKNNWLKFLFGNAHLNQKRITINNQLILSAYKGLKRDKQNYLSHVYLLEN